MALTLGALLGKDVIQVGLASLEATATRCAKPLCGPAIRFHLGHVDLRFMAWSGSTALQA